MCDIRVISPTIVPLAAHAQNINRLCCGRFGRYRETRSHVKGVADGECGTFLRVLGSPRLERAAIQSPSSSACSWRSVFLNVNTGCSRVMRFSRLVKPRCPGSPRVTGVVSIAVR